MSAPSSIIKLVNTFHHNLEAYKSAQFNETQVRRQFIDPFFEALGWDVNNKQGWSEVFKEVVHEDAIKIGGATKAPDYSFRIGGQRVFFVEAKKPSVNIRDDVSPAYQLRRYAWSAKLPLSILTDFEEFAVYDCRMQPGKSDKTSAGRKLYYTYDQYPEVWDDIAEVFSREAVLKGSFQKFAEASKGRGKSEVDKSFLIEIERWRELLAKNIARNNADLSVRDLNFAVQRTIDRIIFLRMCEDRGIETYGQLQSLQNGANVYQRLLGVFHRADEKYNSGLFHFQKEKGREEAPDELTPELAIDDKILKDILRNLYYPDSPYEFSVLPADILGNVYEQFLGKVIRLTPSHRAIVEDKPEVKKAGGVYYTPTYIVDYIVKNTIGKLCEGKTPKQISKLKILDPACGSGSFLIGAYQYLLDFHRDWYVNDGANLHKKEMYEGAGGEWRLTAAERKRILLNNIYGVDIDAQAVETTKLSLLLKVLEGENEETLVSQLKLFKERALPDLGNNIKCGNSLIGPDFYEGGQLNLLDEDERFRINAFDWNREFPEIMNAGGFDAVIGNPPYVLGRETFDKYTKQYFASRYDAFGGKYDLYVYFTERALDLTKPHGIFGFILPNTILANENAVKLRRRILIHASIQTIKTFKERVFEKAQVESVIIIVRNEHAIQNNVIIDADGITFLPQALFAQNSDFRFNVRQSPVTQDLIDHIMVSSVPLGTIADICIGIQLGGSSGDKQKASFLTQTSCDETCKKVLDGKNINRYRKNWAGSYVRYGDWLHRKRDVKYFLSPKIIIRQIGRVPIASYDEDQFYTLNTIYNIINMSEHSLLYFLAIINSKLGVWYWAQKNSDFKVLFPKIKKSQIEAIPIHKINFSTTDKTNHDKIVHLVERMLDLHKKLAAAKSPIEKAHFEKEIAATDAAIDRLVYELYDLTEEEIRIVEGG